MWWPSLRALKDRDPGDLSPRPFGRWGQFGLFLAVFCFFLTVQSRELPWNDAKPIYAAAMNFAFHGRVDASGDNVPKGKRTYDVHPFLASGIHVPGALFQRLLVSRFPQDTALAKIVSSHLGPAALGGLAAVLFVRLCLFLGWVGRQPGVQRGVGHGDHGGDLCPGALVRNGPGRDLPGFFSALMRVLRDYRGKAVWCWARGVGHRQFQGTVCLGCARSISLGPVAPTATH